MTILESINQIEQFNLEVERTNIASHYQRASSILVTSRNLLFIPVRIARFSSLKPLPSLHSVCCSVLATHGCLFVFRPPSLAHFSNSLLNNAELRCAFCKFSVPIADIPLANPNSEVEFTDLLLAQFGSKHAANCKWHDGFLLLKKDDAHFSEAENQSLSATSINSRIGTAPKSCFSSHFL